MIHGRQEPFVLLVSARGVQVIATRVSPALFGALGTECSIETGATLKIGEPNFWAAERYAAPNGAGDVLARRIL